MPPAAVDVQRWIRIITGDAEATLETLGTGPLAMAVRALAEARADIDRVDAAEAKCLGQTLKYARTRLERDPMTADPNDLDDPTVLRWYLSGCNYDRLTLASLLMVVRHNRNGPDHMADRLRRLERYATRACARERKAFAAWLCLAKEQESQNEANYNVKETIIS